MNQHKLWGIDLGGTKTECVVLNINHDIIIRKRIATQADKGYDHILLQIKKLVDEVIAEVGEEPR